MLQQQMLEEVTVVFNLEEANRTAGNATLLLVVLTKGLLRNSRFAEVLLGMFGRTKRPRMLPINADLSFDFPSPDFYTEIEEHGLPPVFGPEDGPSLKNAYFSLMKVLAKTFAPHASITIIDAQIMDICKRIWSVMRSTIERGPQASTDAGLVEHQETREVLQHNESARFPNFYENSLWSMGLLEDFDPVNADGVATQSL